MTLWLYISLKITLRFIAIKTNLWVKRYLYKNKQNIVLENIKIQTNLENCLLAVVAIIADLLTDCMFSHHKTE